PRPHRRPHPPAGSRFRGAWPRPVTRATVQVRAARTTDVDALLAMMAPFNRSEGFAWRPRRVAVALRRLLADNRLGVVPVADEPTGRTARALLRYVVPTFTSALEFAGA